MVCVASSRPARDVGFGLCAAQKSVGAENRRACGFAQIYSVAVFVERSALALRKQQQRAEAVYRYARERVDPHDHRRVALFRDYRVARLRKRERRACARRRERRAFAARAAFFSRQFRERRTLVARERGKIFCSVFFVFGEHIFGFENPAYASARVDENPFGRDFGNVEFRQSFAEGCEHHFRTARPSAFYGDSVRYRNEFSAVLGAFEKRNFRQSVRARKRRIRRRFERCTRARTKPRRGNCYGAVHFLSARM